MIVLVLITALWLTLPIMGLLWYIFYKISLAFGCEWMSINCEEQAIVKSFLISLIFWIVVAISIAGRVRLLYG